MRVVLLSSCIIVIIIAWTLNQNRIVHNVESLASKPDRARPIIYIQPIWGLGNRIRTLRHTYELGRLTGRDVVLVDGPDDTFFSGSLKEHLHLDMESIRYEDFFNIEFEKEIPASRTSKCEITVSIDEITSVKGNIYISGACHVFCKEHDLDTNHMWSMHKFYKPQTDIVGIHIRQGSLTDYAYKNFFGEWNTEESRKGGEPYYCCFENKNNNFSSCPSNIQNFEAFEHIMRNYPSSQKFIVVSDRPGCVIEMHKRFPGQIMEQTIRIGRETDMESTCNDWINLATCKEIIISNISSFSYEASRVYNAIMVKA